MYPKSLRDLIDSFRRLPGVGEKTAERYAMAVMDMPDEDVYQFAEAIKQIKTKLHYCKVCGNLTESDTCEI